MDYWPHRLLPAPEIKWQLVNRVTQGGLPVVGPARTSGMIGAGLWTCELSGIWLRKPEQLKVARALDMILDGGLTPIVVGSCESRIAPWARPTTEVPHSDASPFSDGSFYAGSAPVATVTGAAPLRATSLQIALPLGASLTGGEAFSIKHPNKAERRYQIARVNGSAITFRPELREAVSVGAELHFHNPGCKMKLVNPDEFLGPVRMGRFGEINAKFVEAF